MALEQPKSSGPLTRFNYSRTAPGPQGLQGPAGAEARLTANFTQPASLASVNIQCNTIGPLAQVGLYAFIVGAGFYLVQAIVDSFTLTVQNLGASYGNAAPGTVVASGTLVTPCAPPATPISGLPGGSGLVQLSSGVGTAFADGAQDTVLAMSHGGSPVRAWVSLSGDIASVGGVVTVSGLEGKALPALTSGYLNYNSGAGVWSLNALPSSLPPSGAAGGSLAGTYPNPTIAASGVTAATYGDGTHVPQVTVNSEGRVTAASNVLITGGSSSPTWPNHAIVLGSGSSTLNSLASSATANAVLQCGGAADPVWSTWTMVPPSTAGKVLRSDGTNYVNSAWTLAAPGTSGQPCVSDGTNWTSGGAVVGAAYGGTGQPGLTTHAILIGNGSSGVNIVAAAAANKVLLGQGTSADPAFSAYTLAAPGAAGTVLASDGTNYVSQAQNLVRTATTGAIGSNVNTTVTQISSGISIVLVGSQKAWVDFSLWVTNTPNAGEILTFGIGTSPTVISQSFQQTIPPGGGGGPLATTHAAVHFRTFFNPGAGSYTLYGLGQAAIANNLVVMNCVLIVEIVAV